MDRKIAHFARQPMLPRGVTASNMPFHRSTNMAKALEKLSIVRTGEEYLITLEDRDGDTTEFTVDYDQLDVISESIDEALDSDEEEALRADDEEEEE
jgi:hypothetical protein